MHELQIDQSLPVHPHPRKSSRPAEVKSASSGDDGMVVQLNQRAQAALTFAAMPAAVVTSELV
jgi:hypothetical protein